MSSIPLFKIPTKFTFPDTPDTNNHTLDSFKASVLKDPEAWFNYMTSYHTSVLEFNNYYDALILEAHSLEDTNSTLTQ